MINSIITKLFEIGSLRVGNFTLKSGQQSPIYVDLRAIISFPALLRDMSEAIWQNHTDSADFVCGVPYTALPIATSITLNHNIPMVMRRKEIKDYGTKKMVEGVFEPGQTCIIIEDVVTTGMSILETIKDLEAAGLKVVEILAFLDREQGGAENLRNAGYPFRAATSLTHIAEHLFQTGLIDDTLKQEILQCTQIEGAQ